MNNEDLKQEFFLRGEANNNCVLTTQFYAPLKLFHSQGCPLDPLTPPRSAPKAPSRKKERGAK